MPGSVDNIDLMILCLGANDMLRGINPKETKNNLEEIIEIAKNKNIKDTTYTMEKNPEQAQRSLSKNINEWDYSAEAKKWLKNGASIIGGCCSTTPNHIKEIKKITD